jgi:tetratricopeptide (TPR) repeat protein/TolB-like protein
MIGKIISHYKILEKLGEGGMGVVYKAEDTKLKRTVALKFLPQELLCDSESKARFIHEAQAASALNHPNITTIHEIDEVEGKCFISMEYIEGNSLKELIHKRTLAVDEILGIALKIAEGLKAAHKKEIVHRDVKSDNVMVTDEGGVKIMDFGLAKLKGVTKLTKTGSTLGTLQYMSPEQAQGQEVDQRSDIFSFGVVLYEMITGQLPFKGEHEAAVIYSIVNETPEPLARYKANVPEGLQRIVDKTLEKDRNIRYQSAAEVIADLKGLQREITVGVVARPKKKLLPFIVPASTVFVLVLLFLILKPFKVEVVPEKRAIAEENSLAIMYFENMANREDTERLGEIVTNLLITDLSESEYMRVVSSQRLYDILKLLGREGQKKIDREVATQVATKAKAKWMLLGNILQVEPRTVITTQLVNVESGQVEASQHISGEVKEEIFSLVDKLTIEIKKDLSLPEGVKKEQDRAVADVTTHSPEAYRFYLEGVDHINKWYFTEAQKSFRKALEFDSTFAMAYYRLAYIEWTEGGQEQIKLIAKAVEYSDKVSWKEKHYIKSMEARLSGNHTQSIKELEKIVERYPEEKEAFYHLGMIYDYLLQESEEAIRQFKKAIEIDPLYKDPYNMLAYTYYDMGDFDKCIWAINKYISLAPDEANPYDIRAGFYAVDGKIDQAIESFKKALEIKPDFFSSLYMLGHMYLFKREYVKAESCYKELSSSSEKDIRSQGRTALAFIPLYQGKFKQALEVLDAGIAADRMEQVSDRVEQKVELWNSEKHFLKAEIYEEKKKLNLALKEAEKSMEIIRRAYPNDKYYGQDHYACLLAENDDFDKAEKVAKALKKDIEGKSRWMHRYWLASGYIASARGSLEVSLINFEKAANDAPFFETEYMLAKAYLESGRLGEAVAVFEKILSRYEGNRVFNAIQAVKARYLLGLAYEKSGWNKKAIEKYEEFLDIWKNADPGIPEVEDAKERLEKLKLKVESRE